MSDLGDLEDDFENHLGIDPKVINKGLRMMFLGIHFKSEAEKQAEQVERMEQRRKVSPVTLPKLKFLED